VVGVHATVKGFDRLVPLLAACEDLRVEWHTFGTSDGASHADRGLLGGRVVHHGAYHRRDLGRLLQQAKIDVVLLPSVGPESFSLALSEVIAAGLPVVASHLGALGERVERLGAGWSFDPWQPASLRERLGFLLERRSALVEAARHLRALPVRDEETMARELAEVWRRARPKGRSVPSETAIERARRRYRGAVLGTSDPLAWTRLVRAVRHSAFYRDLPLRRLLPDDTRRRIQGGLARWMGTKKR
jgi:glycosyltransferase involved in cell wall biosynthesis